MSNLVSAGVRAIVGSLVFVEALHWALSVVANVVGADVENQAELLANPLCPLLVLTKAVLLGICADRSLHALELLHIADSENIGSGHFEGIFGVVLTSIIYRHQKIGMQEDLLRQNDFKASSFRQRSEGKKLNILSGTRGQGGRRDTRG